MERSNDERLAIQRECRDLVERLKRIRAEITALRARTKALPGFVADDPDEDCNAWPMANDIDADLSFAIGDDQNGVEGGIRSLRDAARRRWRSPEALAKAALAARVRDQRGFAAAARRDAASQRRFAAIEAGTEQPCKDNPNEGFLYYCGVLKRITDKANAEPDAPLLVSCQEAFWPKTGAAS